MEARIFETRNVDLLFIVVDAKGVQNKTQHFGIEESNVEVRSVVGEGVSGGLSAGGYRELSRGSSDKERLRQCRLV